ncbi:ankyrin repeat containing protein [Apiospora arundinis]
MAPRRCTRVDSNADTDGSDLIAADLDKVLKVISPKVAQEIRDFRMSLGKLQTKQRIKRCQEKRDKLLDRSKDIEIAVVCYELVFQKCSIEKHGEEWGDFDAVVGRSREASKRLKSLIRLSDTWGTEVIEHYNFVSQYRTYCDELRAIARDINTWEGVVPKLNQSIDGRIRKNDGRARVKFSANPIERQDLTYVKNYVKTTENHQLECPGLLPGYGLDKYGLIVREEFAAPLPPSPPPSASSQQHSNHDAIVGGNDCNRSTFVPSASLPPLSDVVSADFNTNKLNPSIPTQLAGLHSSPYPLLSPSVETFPSEPLPTSAWLNAPPLPLLDEGVCIDDRIINAYMHTLVEKHHGVCFLNSHFLDQFGKEMKRWRPEIGKHPLLSDLVMMPIHEKYHWYLLVMYKGSLDEWVVCFLDSLRLSHEWVFKSWVKYLQICGNELMVRQIDVKVPRQTNSTDCGIYVLGFAERVLEKRWEFIEAVNSGKNLGWEINAPALRQDIRAALTAVNNATTGDNTITEGDDHGSLGVFDDGAEITVSLGDNNNSSDEGCWACDNAVGKYAKAKLHSKSLAASSKCTPPIQCIVEENGVGRSERTDTEFTDSCCGADMKARLPVAQMFKPEEQNSTLDDRIFKMLITVLDEEQVDTNKLSTTVHRVLERIHQSRHEQIPAGRADIAPGSVRLRADQLLDGDPEIISSQARKRKQGSGREDKEFAPIKRISTWGREKDITSFGTSTSLAIRYGLAHSPHPLPLTTPTLITYPPSGVCQTHPTDVSSPLKTTIHMEAGNNWASDISTAPTLDTGSPPPSTNQPLQVWASAWPSHNLPGTGPQFQLAMQIRVPDTAQSIAFAMKGDTEGLKQLFSRGLASPGDWALYGGMHQFETVRFLLSQGAYIDEDSYQHVWDYIFRKLCHGYEAQALQCITQRPDRDWVEEQNFPLIHRIIFGSSSKSLMDELVDDPSTAYATDSHGRTALAWATARAQLDDMQLLIAHGSDPNTMDNSGRTAVLHAVDSHDEGALRMILEAGASPNPEMPVGLFRSSPLTSASFGGLPRMMELLIQFGAQIDACNPEGRTALHTAARVNNAECAKVLLENGANLDHVSGSGQSPLSTAIIHNSHSVLKIFVNDRYCDSNLKRPHLLSTIAAHADTESILILASSLVLKQCLYLSGGSFATSHEILQWRTDYDEKLGHAFENLCSVNSKPTFCSAITIS